MTPLGLTAAVSATDAAIHKKTVFVRYTSFGLSKASNINNFERGKRVSKTIKNKTKVQKCRFLSMLLGELAARSSDTLLTGKGTIRAGQGTIRTISWSKFLMLPHPLKNFELQKYYQNEPKFNGVYSRNILPKIMDGAYVINLDEFKSIRTHWIALYLKRNNATYLGSFGIEHIPKEFKKFIGNKDMTTSIYGIQAYDSIISRHFCKIIQIYFLLTNMKRVIN